MNCHAIEFTENRVINYADTFIALSLEDVSKP